MTAPVPARPEHLRRLAKAESCELQRAALLSKVTRAVEARKSLQACQGRIT